MNFGVVVDWDYVVDADAAFVSGATTEYFDVTIANQFGDEIIEQIEITITIIG